MTNPGDDRSDDNGYRPNRWSSQSGGGDDSYPAFGAFPQGSDSQGAHAAPGGADPYAPQPGTANDSFFSALFDFGFTRYATPSIIKIAYLLGFIFIGLVWVGYVLIGFISLTSEFGVGGFFLGLLGVIVITVGVLFMLMSLRMMMEFYLSNIRIAQSTQSLDEKTVGGPQGNRRF